MTAMVEGGESHPRAPRRVTLRDLARHLGVSTATVSLALRNSPRVAEATRLRVQAGMRELGYVYNRGAASLRTAHTATVGVALPDLGDPYFTQLLISMQATLHERGRMVFLSHSGESTALQDAFVEALREYNADGLIVCPAEGTRPEALQRLVGWHMPAVMVTRHLPGTDLSFVGNNDQRGMALATEHLIGLGHRRIAMIGGGPGTSTGRERLAGYQQALERAGIGQDRSLVVPCPTNRRGGIGAIGKLLDGRNPPTAAVCHADIVAFGVLLELSRRGLVAGRDFAVVGHDDVIEAALWNPPLTTVTVQRDAMGVAAANLLNDPIEAGSILPRRVIFEPTLTIRGTCGARAMPAAPRAPERALRR
jgi:LacI family transcriptional regulator